MVMKKYIVLMIAVSIFLPILSLANTGVTTIATGLYNPGQIFVDNNYLYMTEVMCLSSKLGAISKVPIEGVNRTILASELLYPFGIAADSSYIYFSQNSYENGAISRMPVNGGTIENLSTGYAPVLITKDSTHLYWPERIISGGGSYIKKVPLGGGTVTTLSTATDMLLMVAIDNNFVYWGDTGEGTIKKVSKNGGETTVLASGINDGMLFTTAVDNTHVYWTEYGTGNKDGFIRKVPKEGGVVTTIASGLNYPFGLVIDSNFVYWTEGFALNTTQTNGSVKAVHINGGGIITIAQGLNNPAFIAIDGNYIYWTEATFVAPDAGCPIMPPPDGTVKKASKIYQLLGDINNDGAIDISDVILILRMALQIDPIQPCSDLNNDGIVDISDVILTLRMALGLDPLKPCQWKCLDDDVNHGIYRICNYFPLNPGNQWNYTTGDYFISDDTRTCASGYSGILYGTNTYEYSSYMQNAENGLLFAGCQYDVGIFEDMGISITFILPQMKIGETVHDSIPPGVINQYGTTFDVTLIGIETITVPAGTFKTLKIELLINDINKCSYKTTLWLAKGIGMVKVHRTEPNPANCLGCIFVCDPDDDVTKLNTPAELTSAVVDGVTYP